MEWGKTVAIVTGASRGIGATICERLAPRLASGSVVIGVARDEQKLRDLSPRVSMDEPKVTFMSVKHDLSSPDFSALHRAFTEGLEKGQNAPGGPISTLLMVHNAASLEHLHHVSNLDDFSAISNYYNLNLSSVYVVNAAFMRVVKTLQASHPPFSVKVVNITSLAAIEPMKSWSLYCSSKAAREMLFKVLALEEPDMSVLSYAPGPVKTDMHHIAATQTGDDGLLRKIQKLEQDDQVLEPADTVDKMLGLLQSGAYTSGSHVDYYDI